MARAKAAHLAAYNHIASSTPVAHDHSQIYKPPVYSHDGYYDGDSSSPLSHDNREINGYNDYWFWLKERVNVTVELSLLRLNNDDAFKIDATKLWNWRCHKVAQLEKAFLNFIWMIVCYTMRFQVSWYIVNDMHLASSAFRLNRKMHASNRYLRRILACKKYKVFRCYFLISYFITTVCSQYCSVSTEFLTTEDYDV